MKLSIINISKNIIEDRHFMTVLGLLILTSLVLSGYAAINLHPSELQVVTHYTAFGNTNFYRDKWYYLFGFVIFGVLNASLYAVLACKIFLVKGRALAIPFAWLGVVVMAVAIATVYQVFKVAALS